MPCCNARSRTRPRAVAVCPPTTAMFIQLVCSLRPYSPMAAANANNIVPRRDSVLPSSHAQSHGHVFATTIRGMTGFVPTKTCPASARHLNTTEYRTLLEVGYLWLKQGRVSARMHEGAKQLFGQGHTVEKLVSGLGKGKAAHRIEELERAIGERLHRHWANHVNAEKQAALDKIEAERQKAQRLADMEDEDGWSDDEDDEVLYNEDREVLVLDEEGSSWAWKQPGDGLSRSR